MLFNVSQLLKDTIGSTRSFDLIEDLSEIEELDALNPLVGTVQLLRTHSGILVSGEVSTALRVTCSRCLEPVVMPVRFFLEENFRPLTEVRTGRFIHPDDFEGSAEELEDGALLIDEQHMLRLAEVIRQNIWLSMPMNHTCETAGLIGCANINQNLGGIEVGLAENKKVSTDNPELPDGTEDMAEESETPIDPRWSALLELQSSPEDDGSAADTEAN